LNPDLLFKMSVINACLALSCHRRQYSTVNVNDAIAQLRRGPSHLANLNFDLALQLIDLVGWECFCLHESREQELRETLLNIAIKLKPIWARAAVYGRSRVRRVIEKCPGNLTIIARMVSCPQNRFSLN
jgi:hypothetical protein